MRPHVAINPAPHAVPTASMTIPGTSPIMVIPIRAKREGDDRQVNPWPVLSQGDVSVGIGVLQVVSVDPAACVLPAHIAPLVVANTSVDTDLAVVRNDFHDGKSCRRTGAHIQIDCCDCISGQCRTGESDCCGQRGGQSNSILSHSTVSVVRTGGEAARTRLQVLARAEAYVLITAVRRAGSTTLSRWCCGSACTRWRRSGCAAI